MEISPTEYLKPKIVDVDIKSPNRAKVTLEPMERGFGHTLGNALRRVLLSSIPGYAITEVKIDSVVHEYTSYKKRAVLFSLLRLWSGSWATSPTVARICRPLGWQCWVLGFSLFLSHSD